MIRTYIKRFRFKNKIILLFTITYIIPMIIFTQYAISSYGKSILETTNNLNILSSQQLHNSVEMFFQNDIQHLLNISEDTSFAKYLDPNKDYSEHMESVMSYWNYLEPRIRNFGNINIKVFFVNKTLLEGYGIFYHADDEIKNSLFYETAIKSQTKISYVNDDNNIFVSTVIRHYWDICGVTSVNIPKNNIRNLFKSINPSDQIIMIFDDSNNEIILSNNLDYEKKDFYEIVKVNNDNNIGTINNIDYSMVVMPLKDDRMPNWSIVAVTPINKLIANEKLLQRNAIRISTIMILSFFMLFYVGMFFINKRIDILRVKMAGVSKGVFETIKDNKSDEINEIIAHYNKMVLGLKKLIDENYLTNLELKEISIKKREAELYALRSQINPHFLFNTLELIRMTLIEKDEIELSSLILKLSKILRSNICWEGDTISLGKELEILDNYFFIQKSRFGEALQYEINIPNNLLTMQIPSFMLQPIVENAINHGMKSCNEKLLVSIESIENSDNICIVVRDNGKGIQSDELSKINEINEGGVNKESSIYRENSIGIQNVNERIKLYYGNEFGIKINSIVNKGTEVYIYINKNKRSLLWDIE